MARALAPLAIPLILAVAAVHLQEQARSRGSALSVAPSEQATHLRGVVVVHPADCRSNWRFLELLGSPEIGQHITVERVAPPTARGSETLEGALPTPLRDRPIVPLSGAERRTLGRLGYRRGPLLLLYDRKGQLRSIEPAPSNPLALVALGRRLRARDAIEDVPN